MSKTFLVAQREFMENLRTKTFWLGILAAPIGIVLFYGLMFLLADKTDVRKFAILDLSQSKEHGEGWLSRAVLQRAKTEYVKELCKKKVDGAFDEQLPPGRPLRKILDETRGDRAFSSWFFSLADSPLAAIAEAQKILTDIKAKKAEMIAALPTDTEKQELEAELRADEQAVQRLGQQLGTELKKVVEEQSIHASFRQVPFEPQGEDSEKILRQMLQKEEIFAFFVIGPDPLSPKHGSRYFSNNMTDLKLRGWFASHATEVIRNEHIDRLRREKNLADADLAAIRSTFDLERQQVNEDGDATGVETSDVALKWAPVAFVYVLWLTVFIAAQMLLTNTVEEKSNRIIEVLLSSVSPTQLMHGKIYGIAATGLVIVGSWAGFLIGGVKLAPHIFPNSAAKLAELGLVEIASNPLYITCFLGYFLSGYLFYAAVLVALGSVCNSLKEAQNLMQPVMFALFVPLATMIPIANDPNGTMAKVITYIPLYTPFAMMNRAGGPPPVWEFVVSTLLILGSLWVAFRGAAKVFRVGVLMTGKPPRIREILRWMREPVR